MHHPVPPGVVPDFARATTAEQPSSAFWISLMQPPQRRWTSTLWWTTATGVPIYRAFSR
jgi:hypothetical protein